MANRRSTRSYNNTSSARGGLYAPRSQGAHSRKPGPSVLSVVICVLLLVLGLVLGAALGIYVLNPLLHLPQSTAPATITEEQLDMRVGSYTYRGEYHAITARQAILDQASLESRQNANGTYEAPSAEMIVSYARNRILADMVQASGITLDEGEFTAYLNEFMGTSDMAAIASRLGMSQEQARTVLFEAASVKKLRDQIIGNIPAAPAGPTPPADGNREVANEGYANYIIGLLGSHWDANNHTWADTNNPYYQALSTAVFSATSANYEAAELAYAAAFQEYSDRYGSVSDAWDNYVNGFLDQAAITVDTLRS